MAVSKIQVKMPPGAGKGQWARQNSQNGQYPGQNQATTYFLYDTKPIITTNANQNYTFFSAIAQSADLFTTNARGGKMTNEAESVIVQTMSIGIVEVVTATGVVQRWGPIKSSSLAGFANAFFTGNFQITINNQVVSPFNPAAPFDPDFNPGSMRGQANSGVFAFFSELSLPPNATGEVKFTMPKGFTGPIAAGIEYYLRLTLGGYGTILRPSGGN